MFISKIECDKTVATTYLSLHECSIGFYKVKAIISSHAIELELLSTIKIHLVVNVSRV